MTATPLPVEAREPRLREFIARLVAEIEPLHLAFNRATWLANITGDPVHEAEAGRLDAAMRTVFARREAYQFLRSLQDAGGVADPQLQRQLVLLTAQHRAQQIAPERIARMVAIEKSLESRFNTYRATLDGASVTDNGLLEVLRESDDVARRRRAWEASKQIGSEVVGELLDLVRMRNDAAREIGYRDYYAMMLELDELDEGELTALLDEIDRGTRPLFEAYRQDLDPRIATRFGIRVEDLRPWHLSDPFFQEAPAGEVSLDPWYEGKSLEAMTDAFFSAIGFDIRETLARADLYEKPGKCQHAFCITMDRLADVRVLCNLRSNEYWMATLLHEFGHAVYDLGIDRSLPFVLRTPAHTLTTEAVAMLFGRLSRNAAWLARWAGMPAAEARTLGEASRRAIRAQLLVTTRWELVMCAMERELYRDPEQDLNTRWWDLVERYQWVTRPEGRQAPDWASKIHFSVAPVYYQNYLLGEIMASQIQGALLGRVLGGGADAWERFVSTPAVGRHLTERLFRPGRAVDWRHAVRDVCGAPFSSTTFVDELAGRD